MTGAALRRGVGYMVEQAAALVLRVRETREGAALGLAVERGEDAP